LFFTLGETGVAPVSGDSEQNRDCQRKFVTGKITEFSLASGTYDGLSEPLRLPRDKRKKLPELAKTAMDIVILSRSEERAVLTRHLSGGELMEINGGQMLWRKPAAFANAQQFPFACLVSVGLVAFVIARQARRGAE
jgi:hypothetical protein